MKHAYKVSTLIQLIFFISLSQIVSCSLSPLHCSVAERRKFSSPQALILNRLILKESKQQQLCGMIRQFAKVKNIYHLSRVCDAIDDEIEQARIDINDACLEFAKKCSRIKKFDNSVSDNVFIKTEFCNLCSKVKEFYNQNLDMLMFDDQSVKHTQFFNKRILYEMRKFAKRYNFSTEYIPWYVIVSVKQAKV